MRKYDSVDLDDIEIEAITNIIDDFENDEQSVRERQIRDWKRKDLIWAGFTNTYWDFVNHDWRSFEAASNDGNDQGSNSDKNINVFRGYGETIIAALSASVPPIKGIPDNNDNPNDVLTAKAGSKIAQLVYGHVNAPLLWVRILFTYYLQGMVAAYNYTDEDDKYGSVEMPESKTEEVDGEQTVCSNCGVVIAEKELDQSMMNQDEDKYDPDDDDAFIHGLMDNGGFVCPECLSSNQPEMRKAKVEITRIIGKTNQPKSRQCIEINGGLFVAVPNWARSQADCPYIRYDYETHYSTLYEEYPLLWDKLKDVENSKISSADGNQLYERWGRLNNQYRGEYPLNCPTVKNTWLRKSAFNSLNDKELADDLKEKFPDGCHALFINDTFIYACNENMDDHWTLMINPLSKNVTYDALSEVEIAIQEITTMLIALELQCIEHSVPITFYNPKYLNGTQFGKTEVSPGGMYPTRMVGENRNIGDGFHQLQTASVSPELNPFGSKINEMGQFVLGAMPQIWGGTSDSSSRTASQYAMQSSGAKTRLTALAGRTVNSFWKDIWSKVIPAYMKNMLEDERIVTPLGKDSFTQVVIKKAETEGKIGSYYLEAPEGLPQSVDQVRATLMEMMSSGNPAFLSAISTPQNIPFMAQLFGITGISIPGEKDREKQYDEIQQLIQTGPIPNGMGGESPSVMPEFFVDNHQIEGEICRDWLVGEEGRQCKVDNEPGYRNVLLHLQIHMQMMQTLAAPPMMGNPQAQPSGGDPNAQKTEQPPKRELRPVSKAS